MKERFSRREFLRLSSMTVAGVLVSSCSPTRLERESLQEPVLIGDEATPTLSPISVDKEPVPVAFTFTPEPSFTPKRVSTFKNKSTSETLPTETLRPFFTSTPFPTETAIPTATFTNPPLPTKASMPTSASTPLPTLVFEIAPYSEVPAEDKWIEVDLSEQYIVAYERSVPVWVSKVSTGIPLTPTKIGEYRIYSRLITATMRGPGYETPGVPWIMYYDPLGYAIHGAYWHNNFGQVMSHGCVNLPVDKAEWLFKWVPDLEEGKEGTLVIIHE